MLRGWCSTPAKDIAIKEKKYADAVKSLKCTLTFPFRNASDDRIRVHVAKEELEKERYRFKREKNYYMNHLHPGPVKKPNASTRFVIDIDAYLILMFLCEITITFVPTRYKRLNKKHRLDASSCCEYCGMKIADMDTYGLPKGNFFGRREKHFQTKCNKKKDVV